MTLILHYFTKWCTLRKNSWRCRGKKSSRLVSHLLMSIVSDAHIKEVVKVLWHRAVLPLQTVQSYSPGGAYVPLAPPGEYDWTCASFTPPPSSQPKRQIIRFSRFCTAHGRSPYTLQWAPLSPKIAPSHQGIGIPPNTIPWANPRPQPKRHLDRSSHFCRAHQCDTDRQTTLLGR